MSRSIGTISRRGFTLIEAVMSAAVLGIIMLGLHSAMLVASRAAPGTTGLNAATANAAAAIDQISADLMYATTIVAATANAVEFTVPDRTGDNSPETIRYSWSGVAGEPLRRSINGGSEVAVTSAEEFGLEYIKRSRQRTQTYTESGEVLLSSYDFLGFLGLGDGAVDSGDWFGTYFKPLLPPTATHWRVTRAKFKARTHGPAVGQTRVQIRTANGKKPGMVIEEKIMLENSLTSAYTWQEITFSNVAGRPADTGLCLVLQWGSDADACDVQYQSLLWIALNTGLVKTTNGGASWSFNSLQQMGHYVYGTYSTADPAAHDYWLTAVQCTLRCGSDPASRAQTSIRVFNEPQVSGP